MSLIRAFRVCLGFAVLAVVTSCAGAPKSIPNDLLVPELIQKAQDAAGDDNYKAAEAYYQAVIDRYSDNPEAVCIAEFEIAHLRIKKEQWADAKVRLEALLAKFDNDTENILPGAYKVLAAIDYKKIPVDDTIKADN